ncbi:MAG: DUF927 domain-containing protein [Actinomycetota bacterium]
MTTTTPRPTALPVKAGMIPIEMRSAPQWVIGKAEQRDGKWTKPPYQVNGNPASHTKAATWDTFGNVFSAYSEGEGDYVGFVLSPRDPLFAVDIDHSIDCATNEVYPWALQIVRQMNTYTERSPSGYGLRLIGRGQLPAWMPKGGGKRGGFGDAGTGAVEVYSSLRYVTLTGHHLEGTPAELQDRGAEVVALCEEQFPEKLAKHKQPATTAPASPVAGISQDDNELLSRMFGSKRGAVILDLWNGGLGGHSSTSEGDAALCTHLAWWTGSDPSRMDRLFRQSRRLREKWDELRGDQTYGELTIELGMAGMGETYSGPSHMLDISDLLGASPEALTTARETACNAVAQLDEDPGACATVEALAALALLRREAPEDYARLHAEFRRRGMIREMERLLTRARPTRGPGELRRAGEALTDCPAPEMRIPNGFLLHPERTCKQVEGSDGEIRLVTIAESPILFKSFLRDEETGGESARLAWRRRGQWKEKVVDLGGLVSGRRLLELASEGFPVGDSNSKHLAEYHLKAANANQHFLPCERVSSHLAWQGKHGAAGFLWGRELLPARGDTEPLSFHGQAAGDEQLADAFTAAGTFEAWREAMAPLPRFPKVLLLLYASLGASLLEITGCPNFVVDVANRTSTGKTSALRVAAAVWGVPDEFSPHSLLRSWDTTSVFVERAAAVLDGLPLFLNDTKRARKPEFVASTLYEVANGSGRGRGNLASLATTRALRTILFSSGEQPATSFTQDGGTRTRCLEITGAPFGGNEHETVNRLNAAVLAHHGHAGPRFVRWLLADPDRWPQIRERYRELVNHYAALTTSEGSFRLAQYFGLIDTAAELAHEALALPWDLPTEALADLWVKVAEAGVEASGEVWALQYVMSWAGSRQQSFVGRCFTADLFKGGQPTAPVVSGKWDADEGWDEITFYEDVLKRVLTEGGFSPPAILAGWRERGWLTMDGKHFRVWRNMPNGRHRMYVITRQAVDEAENSW